MHTASSPAGLVLSVSAILSFTVHAQEPLSLLPPMDDMVVTAARTPLNPQDVGSGYTIIDRQLIEERQAVFALDLLRDVPGLAIARSGGYGSQTQVRVRGAESNHVLVFIDGVKVNDPAGNDEFALEHLTTFDIERIEVIRGPQSALWGSDALAGVINIITRRAREPFAADAFAEGGAFGTFTGGGRLALAGERSELSLGASHLDSGGTNISREGDENDGYRNSTATLQAGWRPAEGVALELLARHSDNRREFDATDFATGLPVDADRLTKSAQSLVRIGGRAELRPDWQHSLRLTWLGTDLDSFADGDPDGSQGADKYGVYYETGLPLLTAGPGGPRDRLSLALEYEHEEFRQRGEPTPFGDPNQRQSMNARAAALEYLLRPAAGVSLSASLRHDRNSDFQDVTTWRTTASWRLPAMPLRLHGSYGTGQKTPTFIERFGFFPDSFAGNPALKPERSRGWDIGIEQWWFNERLVLDTTWFQADLRDEINGFVFDPGTGGFTAANLDGRSRREGLELALTARLLPELSLSGSYTLLDATEPGGEGQFREIRRPRHSASGNLNWRWAAGRGNLNLNVSHVGERRDLSFASFPAEVVRLDSYTLLTLAASWQLDSRLTLYGRVENLLDEDYEDVLGFATPGIGAWAGFRMAWGR